MRRRRTTSVAPSVTGWDVVVTPAVQHREADYYTGYRGGELHPVVGEIAVKLTKNGKSQMSYGTVQIQDPEFEDKITTMKAEAMEKASALNAVGA